MKDASDNSFDNKLAHAISLTNQEISFKIRYEGDEESRYSLTVLEDIAKSTATVLQNDAQIQVESEEKSFELVLENTIKVSGLSIVLIG